MHSICQSQKKKRKIRGKRENRKRKIMWASI
jgi:hypothetical protein